MKGTEAAELLEEGDMLLRVGGSGVCEGETQNFLENEKAEKSAEEAVVPTCFMDVERAADSWQGDQGLPMTVWRQGAITHLVVPLSHESCEGTGRLLHWAGLQLQETHRHVPIRDNRARRPQPGFIFCRCRIAVFLRMCVPCLSHGPSFPALSSGYVLDL